MCEINLMYFYVQIMWLLNAVEKVKLTFVRMQQDCVSPPKMVEDEVSKL